HSILPGGYFILFIDSTIYREYYSRKLILEINNSFLFIYYINIINLFHIKLFFLGIYLGLLVMIPSESSI
ncbi:hypothetical protein DD86_19325, partial [Salmonella enterica subsp. enterica serovar Typhimurium var. 5-]